VISESAQRRGQIADDRRLVARNVARIGVLQNSRIRGAKHRRGAQDGDRRPTAACVLGAVVQSLLQGVRIDAFDAVDYDAIHLCGSRSVLVVRKIGAGNQQRTAPPERRGQGVTKRPRGRRGLVAHQQGHDPDSRRETLNKRQLHFERMLASVDCGVGPNNRGGRHHVRGAGIVDRCDAEWRFEAARRECRDAVEPDEVRRPHQHSHIELTIAEQSVGVRGDRARIHQPSVRRNQGDEIAVDVGASGLEMGVNRGGERRR